ncbi:RNA polymerase sigma factor [Spirosoma endbachense]|uniref:Sigma-70 family RNA polymerase sigma factor n=1 Tax=Spirosoma endbachense TaxID=2666025 RepID=A0A6P1VQD2_9BACT|nr:sigma-70 family RNA polymerase sigma factor [Spirosoma endbachense]QHV93907.1 sigma-70 family RNA polymerase sigma factor [Spirosoma endbachense]
MKTNGPAPAVSDLLLWQLIKNSNESGLRKLVEKYFNALQNYGYKFVRDEDFVKDCVQEVFIDIWSRRDRISSPDSVRAYLLSSVRKRVLREGYRQRINRDDEPTDLENDLSFVEFSPEWSLIEQESLVETTQRISASLNQLPKRQREVIYLRYYQNLERDEIADIMGVNPQSVSNLLQAAFKTFRENWVGFLILTQLVDRIAF